MKNKITKYAAAAAVIIAIAVSVGLLDKTIKPAYALSQTVDAYADIRYVHTITSIFEGAKQYPEEEENWIKIDDIGRPSAIWKKIDDENYNARIYDWDNQIVKTWDPKKNQYIIKYSVHRRPLELENRIRIDPKYAIEILNELEEEGIVKVETEDTFESDTPIRVVATQTDEYVKSKSPYRARRRYVFLVDRTTKLVKQYERYFLSDGQFKLRIRKRFLEQLPEYSAPYLPIDPPEGANFFDKTIDAGLAQNNLSESQLASEIVRKFIQALVEKDYDLAAKLNIGPTPDEFKESIEERQKIKYLRVIDVGQAIVSEYKGAKVFLVPFEFEYEDEDGNVKIKGPREAFEPGDPGPTEHRKAMVGTVPNHPDRWFITGGI